MEQRGSTTAIAPVVLGLFVAVDVLRPRFPDARWHMWYAAMACGMVNGVSATKASAVTCMITGHSASTTRSSCVPAPRGTSHGIPCALQPTRLGCLSASLQL